MDGVYSPMLSGNIMIIGGTDTGKTSYLQEIIINKFLPPTIKKIYWVSGIYLTAERINQLTHNFNKYDPKFTHVPDTASFNKVISNLKIIPESNKKHTNNDSDNSSDANPPSHRSSLSGSGSESSSEDSEFDENDKGINRLDKTHRGKCSYRLSSGI